MLNEIPLCPICYTKYNQVDNTPRILPACGHTICSQCLATLLKGYSSKKCPLDKVQFHYSHSILSEFPINFALKDLLDNSDSLDFCSVHKRMFRFVCMVDQTKVCDDCVIFGEHRDHDLKSMDEVRVDKAAEQKFLGDILSDLKSHRTDLMSTLDKKKLMMMMSIRARFEELNFVLQGKESELVNRVGGFFESGKKKLNKTFVNQAELGSEIIKKINDRKDIFHHTNFFEIMNDKITTKLAAKPDTSCFLVCQKTIDESFEKIYSSLDGALGHLKLPDIELSLHDFISDSDRLPLCVCKELPYDFCKHSFDEVLDKATQEQNSNSLELRTYLDVTIEGQVLKISLHKESKEAKITFNPKEWSNLTTIEYDVESYGITYQDRNLLCHIWHSLEKVTSIIVRFSSSATTDDHLMNVFSILFPRTKGMRHLRLNLKKCSVSDRSISELLNHVIGRMHELESLELILDSTGITDKSLVTLGEDIIPLMKGLEIFKIDLREVSGMTNKGIMTLLRAVMQVKELRLNIRETSIGDDGLSQFSQEVLSKMKNLNKLEIYLESLNITDSSFLELLFNLNEVKELTLHAQGTKVTDDSAQAMIDVITTKNIRKFSIELSGTEVRSGFIEQLQDMSNAIQQAEEVANQAV